MGSADRIHPATVLVAAVDAVGITAGALILRVPFALAIGVLVFLLSFIPIVGALLSGAVAVLIALVAQGPVTALIMLAVVIGVQQVLESHILQPFILGRSVRIHPLAIIAAIATGAILAGIVGTLVAVPIAAVVKSVAENLFRRDDGEGDDRSSPARAASRRCAPGGRRVARLTWCDPPAGRSGLGLADVDQPADAVLVGQLPELVAPHLLLQRRADVGAVGEALPVARRVSASSPLRLTVMLDPGDGAVMNDGVSAPMIVKPAPVSSWPCMTRSPSAPSVPYSLK